MADTTSEAVVEYEGRFIAFLDILGFSKQLETRKLRDIHRQYADLMDRAHAYLFDSRETGVQGNFAKAQFLFDSILLVSHPLDGKEATANAFNFLSAVGLLVEWGLEASLPVRGAIGLGGLLEDSKRNISLSATVPSLLKEEREQEWVGVALSRTAASAAEKHLFGPVVLPAKAGGNLVVRYDVPTKRGPVASYCLNWVYMCDIPDIATGIAYLEEPKRGNTEAFIRHVEGLPKFEVGLPAKFLPVTKVRVLAALRDGSPEMLSIKFLGEDGRGVDHPSGFRFTWDGRGISIIIGDVELANMALHQRAGSSERS